MRKLTKLIFVTDRHTYYSDLIGPSLAGVQKVQRKTESVEQEIPSQNDHITAGSVDEMILQQVAAVENDAIQS